MRYSQTKDIRVSQLKNVTKKLNCTINDLILAMLSTTLTNYFKGQELPKDAIVNMLVNLRSAPTSKDQIYFGNELHVEKIKIPLTSDFDKALRSI